MITREDTHDGTGPYTTGVRIQMFSRVKDGTGKSAKQFILDFIAAKKKEAAKVIKTCEPKEQYLFTRNLSRNRGGAASHSLLDCSGAARTSIMPLS